MILLHKRLKWLAIFTAIWMFLVLLGGALVTKTDSGDGCGDDWPLCNGKFVPAYTIESMIEYSHRIVSGIVGLLVLVIFIWVLMRYRQRKDIVLYAGITLFFTVLQGGLGAAAVVWGQSSAVMALHFGFSLAAFASTLLLAIAVARIDQPAHPSGWGEAKIMNGPSVNRSFRLIVWLNAIYTYVVVYFGAYVRHTESWAGCEGWPLCNGYVIPPLSGETGIAFLHRVSALPLVILVIYMVIVAVKQYGHIREIRVSSWWALALTILQNLSGALVVFTLTSVNGHLFSGMVHTVLVAGLFGVLSYMSILVWQMRGVNEKSPEPAEAPQYAAR